MNLKLIRLDGRRFQAFERLLSGKEFGGCFCAVWRNSDDAAKWKERCSDKPQENLEDTRARIEAGEHVGFLVTREVDGAVIGWTGSGPKTNFTKASWWPGSQMGPQDDSAWAVGCLAIGFEHRSRGYAREIIELVAEQAAKAGAAVLEAYPADPCNDDSAWCGCKSVYQQAGFETIEEHPMGERRILRMVKKLREDAVVEAGAAPSALDALRTETPASPPPEPEPEVEVEESADEAQQEQTPAPVVAQPREEVVAEAPAHDVASVVERLKAQPQPQVSGRTEEVPAETETPAEAGAETPAETPAETETPAEAAVETPAETETPVEAVAETPAETETPVEAAVETPAETETPVEAVAETPAETETPVEAGAETPAETPAETETPVEVAMEEKKDPA